MACQLHDVRDVYILEHRNCGAYRVLLGERGAFGDSAPDHAAEAALHNRYAQQLAAKIRAWSAARPHYPLQVRCFLMDLRGGVELLETAG